MSKKLLSLALIAVGLLAGLVSLLADLIGPLQLPVVGLTVGEDPGFGSQQTAGTIIGLLLLLTGIGLWRDWLKMSRGLAGILRSDCWPWSLWRCGPIQGEVGCPRTT